MMRSVNKVIKKRKFYEICRFMEKNFIDIPHYVDKPYIFDNNLYIYKPTNRRLILKNKLRRRDNTSYILNNLSSRNIAVSLGILLMKFLKYIKIIKKRNVNICIKDKNVFIEVEGKSMEKKKYNFMDIIKLKNQFISKNNKDNIIIDHISDDMKFKIALPPLRMFPRRYFVPNLTSSKCTL
ncbi:Hypothetical protein SRAE_X000022100 [Strongyloides ratti]|uniref:Uncharacterized protein n=1 Tax=Strongyloides ratti TaxID=34506 RepID=A0A090LMC1_STRRB|nr:Hypothetical protein SRAE_X000022100 [Strongyloides ratti]CEF70891.1 Hypothetical protein SRAE_X000022100 [Strongyloides ratti]